MKTLFLSLTLVLSGSTIFAQQLVRWIGGTPGQETNWHEARNWSNYKVPDTFSNVLIPDVSTTTFSAPFISGGIVELNTILIESNAQFRLAEGALLIVHEQATGLEKSRLQLSGTIVVIYAAENEQQYSIVRAPKRND
jgi:hypothetical protein